MGNSSSSNKFELSPFRKTKLLHEFHTFYDVNKDGQLQWKDFELARENICDKSGWKPGTQKWIQAINLFQDMWRRLQDSADEDTDGTITEEEWIHFWTLVGEKAFEEAKKVKKGEIQHVGEEVPDWLEYYIKYKFDLYDRAADGHIDIDEFEYVLSWFDMPPAECRAAFKKLSMEGCKRVDFTYFHMMTIEYFQSDDPMAPGNFINGKMDYSNEEIL